MAGQTQGSSASPRSQPQRAQPRPKPGPNIAERHGVRDELPAREGSRREPSREFDEPSNSQVPQAQSLFDLADQLQALARELKGSQGVSATAAVQQSGSSDLTSPNSEANASPGNTISRNSVSPGISEKEHFLRAARARYEARRKRVSVFQVDELFGEPAWDILLDLYIAYAENKSVSVSSACIGSASPPTTGLRWLGVLQGAGLIDREHDPRDQRRVLVRLTHDGVQRMEAYFREALPAQRSAAF